MWVVHGHEHTCIQHWISDPHRSTSGVSPACQPLKGPLDVLGVEAFAEAAAHRLRRLQSRPRLQWLALRRMHQPIDLERLRLAIWARHGTAEGEALLDSASCRLLIPVSRGRLRLTAQRIQQGETGREQASATTSGTAALALANLDADYAVAGRTVAVGVARADAVDDIHPAGHPAEDAVLAVEMRCRAEGDEELRAVGVGAGVRHAQDARTVVLEGQRATLVGEFVAWAAGAGAGRVAALRHEALDDAVEGGAVVEAVTGECPCTPNLYVNSTFSHFHVFHIRMESTPNATVPRTRYKSLPLLKSHCHPWRIPTG
jgi:hypothetical protein